MLLEGLLLLLFLGLILDDPTLVVDPVLYLLKFTLVSFLSLHSLLLKSQVHLDPALLFLLKFTLISFLSLHSLLFKSQISLNPALLFLVLFHALLTAVLPPGTANPSLVLSFAEFFEKLMALGFAVIYDPVATRLAFVDATFQNGVTVIVGS